MTDSLRSKRFRTSDGAELAVMSEGHGPTLVMLHGWVMGSGYFDAVRAQLAAQHRLILIDFRGNGQSGPCVHGHRMARYAADVHEVLTAYHDDGPLSILD
jgi:non-heme chloroperoxidase